MFRTQRFVILFVCLLANRILPAYIPNFDTSNKQQSLTEFSVFQDLPGELQDKIMLHSIDTIETDSTKKWIVQSRTTSKKFNTTFGKVLQQAPAIFELLKPEIERALLKANFDPSAAHFPTIEGDKISELLAQNIIATNTFYAHKIAQGALLPSFCDAQINKNRIVFFQPYFGCHLINCCSPDINSPHQDQITLNKQINFDVLLSHIKAGDLYGQEIAFFIQKANSCSTGKSLLYKLTQYIPAHEIFDYEKYLNWQQDILFKNITVGLSPEEAQAENNMIELTKSLQNQVAQRFISSPAIMQAMIAHFLNCHEETPLLDGYVQIMHQNMGDLIAPHINNAQLDHFLRYMCIGIHQSISQQIHRNN